MITCSIVTYKNDKILLRKAINSFLNSDINSELKLFLINNAESDDLFELSTDKRIEYLVNSRNLGFGAGHNIAMTKSIGIAKYHLILNPDIYFDKDVIQVLFNFMEKNPSVGLVTPKVLFFDGQTNFVCRLLPTPRDIFVRRFIPIQSIVDKNNAKYELRFSGYDKTMEAPYISGCFMFVRTKALEKSGIFNDDYFMYFEDVDLSRRIHRFYNTVFYPYIKIYHEGGLLSHKNKRLLLHHLISSIKYFNNYGWFYDKERKMINEKILKQLGYNI
jgi:GT2 family glycosyltransferase